MYISYTLYQADHIKTARQQREEDIRTGELAAGFARLLHGVTARRTDGQRGFRQAPEIEMLTEARASCSGPGDAPETIRR
jgi:hypothetical protein